MLEEKRKLLKKVRKKRAARGGFCANVMEERNGEKQKCVCQEERRERLCVPPRASSAVSTLNSKSSPSFLSPSSPSSSSILFICFPLAGVKERGKPTGRLGTCRS